MEINKKTIEYDSNGYQCHIIPIGDIHLGNIGCEETRLRELVCWIQNTPDVYVIGMGDYVDCINYTDKRFDYTTIAKKYRGCLDNIVQHQTEDFIKIISPISDRILGFHRGNHEEHNRLIYSYDPLYEIVKHFDFKIPELKDTALTRLHFKRQGNTRHCMYFDIYSMHGRVGGRKGGNKINWLEDMIGYIDADVYLIAHAHIKETEVKTQLFIDKELNVKQKKKILGVTGSFLKGYTKGAGSYVEKWMLPPTDLGVIKVTLVPERGDIHVSL